MKKILKYIAHYWYAYLFAIACMAAAIVLDMLYPVITKSIVDDVIIKGQTELLGGLLFMIVLIGAGRSLGGYLKEFTFDVVSVKIAAKLRKDLFAHIEGLSIGQRQLLAFARTMVSMPKILILDEATSSIDTHTELLVQKGIEALLKGRTSFVIAHRLSTVQRADRIFVIDKGGILEQGSPAELMQQKGHYYNLYMAQFKNVS